MQIGRSISVRILLVTSACVLFSAALLKISGADPFESVTGGGLLLLLLATTMVLSHVAIIQPFTRRFEKLTKLAGSVGKAEETVEPEERNDEIGQVSRALAGAHRRMLDHERLLSAQYQALRLKQINVAHDLRTPLTSLLMSLENARDAAMTADEDPAPSIRDAMAEALYMTSLVQNLRIASRMDAGFASLGARAPLDLTSLVQRVANRFRLLAKGGGTEIHVAYPDEPVMVEGDDTMIEQLVTNLVQNSLTYGGGIDQQVIINLDAEDGRFTLDVLDEGPGISPDALELITERWVRGAAGKGRSKSGQGLGLAIVSEVAAVHEWKLSLTNREERGLRARVEGATTSAP
jgi:two-component system OmpR family sensor kinase